MAVLPTHHFVILHDALPEHIERRKHFYCFLMATLKGGLKSLTAQRKRTNKKGESSSCFQAVSSRGIPGVTLGGTHKMVVQN